MSSVVAFNTVTGSVEVFETGLPGPAGLVWQDSGWLPDTRYQRNWAVYHDGTSYRALVEHVSTAETEPGLGADWETVWQVLVEKGGKGDAATIEVGDVTTLEPDQPASVENVGTSGAARFNFGIPKGDKGDTGDVTPEAEAARDAAQIAAGTATTQANRAETEADRAELARDAATINADVYADTTAGLAGTSEGDQFQVDNGDEIVRYRHDAGPVATEVAHYPSAANVAGLRDSLLATTQVIGLPDGTAFPAGSNATFGTYTFNTPIDRDGVGLRFRYRCLVAGTMAVQIHSKSGTTVTVIDERIFSVTVGTGEVALMDLAYEEGQYVGVKLLASGRVAAQGGGAGGAGGWWYTSALVAKDSTYTTASLNTTTYIVMGFDLLEQTATGPVVKDHEARITALEGSTALPLTYMMVWGIGESHIAGAVTTVSPVAIPAGAGYSYRRATGELAHLQDPTGNVAGSIGPPARGTVFPGFGDAMLKLSHGRMGAVAVNSGVGGTTVGHWLPGNATWTNAVADWNNALDAVLDEEIIVSGVSAVIGLGSNDAVAGTTKVDFKSRYLDIISNIRATVGIGDDLPIVLIQTGSFANNSHAALIAEYQEAQAEICREVPNVYMGYSARYAVTRGQMSDNVHMTQAWNDDCGAAVAVVAVMRSAGLYPAGLE